jgi:hypothetical protein
MAFYDAGEFVIQDALSSHARHSKIQYLHAVYALWKFHQHSV